MRIPLLLTLLALLAPAVSAEEREFNEEVVKAVRAAYSARKEEEFKELKGALFAREELDWPSVKKGLTTGVYYQKPLVTAYGERHSGRHLGLRLRGKDGRNRGFSLYVPEKYDASFKIPVIVYLHHYCYRKAGGAERAGVALFKFRKVCEENTVLFVAPYTMKGAEWWTPEGLRLVRWTLDRVKERYNIDEDRIALLGAMDGADSVWALAQEMPGTWSCLMPMSGDAYDMAAYIRPLYLGTLDRMDVLMGVTGKYKSGLGEKNANQFLAALKPMFDKRMRITAAIYPTAEGDFRYLPSIRQMIVAFAKDRKRKPLANEVDIATDAREGQRSLWLESHGYDAEGETPHNFPTTLLEWKPPERKDPKPKLGVHLAEQKGWEVGLLIRRSTDAAQTEHIFAGDILLEVDGVPVKKTADVRAQLDKHDWKEEVRVLVAREVEESELERQQERQALYLKVIEKRRRLRAEGKPVPTLSDMLAEEEDAEEVEEEEDEGESIIEIGEGPDPKEKKPLGEGIEEEKMVPFVFERFLYLRRPEGKLVRADFGASWDPSHEKEGVKLRNLVAHGQAERSGFKEGDVIVAVGADKVEKVRDVQAFFEDFKFEKEPEGQRFVEFTIMRPRSGGGHDERTVVVRWEPPTSSRVDARWDKQDKSLHVLARKCKGFTLYFTDELIDAGEAFHLYINNVPVQDLLEPSTAPEYPRIRPGTDPVVRDELRRMRRRRSKVEGWTPDPRWAVEHALERRDRSLVFGAKRSYDLTKMGEGFQAARERNRKRDTGRGARIKEAYDRWRAQE